MKRHSNGQFKYKPFKHSNWSGLILLLSITSLSAYLNYRFEPQELYRPLVGEVKALELPVKVTTEPQTIEEYITYKFGKDSESALKIARCESQRDGKIQPDLIGDTHLMSMNNGEMVGDSIGVFQIRTGGNGWNRAKANGMTADEFRTKLKDWKYNIDYAKTIFDNAKGWTPWFNCMNKELK